MAVPKKRHSNARSGKRRAHHALKGAVTRMQNIVQCKNCGKYNLAHRACRCGA